jgi:Tol biopolymer transport system component
MAPEQVRGLPVDQRADMFAFGAVLYEMLSGQRAFAGETAADSMSAVLTKDPPDLDAVKFAIPPSLDRIVRRCLEKSPDLRFQSANDLAFALDTLSSVSSGASTVSSTPPTPAGVVTSTSKAAMPSWLPWTVAVAAVLAAGATWLIRGAAPRTDPAWNTFTRITEAAGEETSPSLSPDGATVAFAVRVNGSWDIYVQRVGGRIATPLVNDPQRDERSPAFSPDGSLIAFHESDIDGGIFIAGATGESVRRLTDFGFEPAWSPDGTSIAFATEEINNPAGRKGNSTLYVVPAAGGTPRKVVDGDGVQPHFSPAGDRLVYWSNTSGQRDIFTVPVAGGERVPLTNDAAIDWSPIWSPDGRFIYFSSDRGGAMNLWRIAVDTAGRAVGAPEPMTSGVQATASLPSLSKDGTRIAFRSRVASTNPVAIPFDPVTARAGTPFLLDTANNIRVPSDVSPDGKQLAYFSIGERQEDLFVGPIGGPMRRVTDDVPRDRAPVFTPDGRSLVFYSTRDGAWALWMIGVDGGNPRKIVGGPAGTIYPLISPKGDTIVFTGAQNHRSGTVPFGSSGATATALPGVDVGGKYFQPMGWSPDGTRLAGTMEAESGRVSGVAIYDLSSHATTLVSSDETAWVHWLPDNRRVVYFAKNGRELVVVDTATRARMVVDVRLPGPSLDETFTMSRDGRTIYYGAVRAEADIWIMERK